MLPASSSSYMCYQAFSLHCSFFDASKLLACPKAKELAEKKALTSVCPYVQVLEHLPVP